MAFVARSRASRDVKSRVGDGATFTGASGFFGLCVGGGAAALEGESRGVDRCSGDGDGAGARDGTRVARWSGVGASTTGGTASAGGTRSTAGGDVGGVASVSGGGAAGAAAGAMGGGADATGGGAGAIEGATATVGVGAVARMHPAPDARMSTMLVTAAVVLTWSSVLMFVIVAHVRPAPAARHLRRRESRPVAIMDWLGTTAARTRPSATVPAHVSFFMEFPIGMPTDETRSVLAAFMMDRTLGCRRVAAGCAPSNPVRAFVTASLGESRSMTCVAASSRGAFWAARRRSRHADGHCGFQLLSGASRTPEAPADFRSAVLGSVILKTPRK